MKILLTGGGTAGHITPNIALIHELKKMGYNISYIGTKEGMEYDLIKNENVEFYPIKAGKLRRYFDFKTIPDFFRVIKGFFQSFSIIRKIKPDVIFSKGGFVSCPVIWAGWILKVPIVIHESDYTPGLANKLAMPFSKEICLTFPETKDYIKSKEVSLTGLPVRKYISDGDCERGYKMCNFTKDKPVILVIGGSQGSAFINNVIRSCINKLIQNYQICHICGKGSINNELDGIEGYKQYEYVSKEIADLFKMADIIISRAGATSIFEILELKKPNILIPLSKKASRGDQILNAKSFEKRDFSKVIAEEDLNTEELLKAIKEVLANKDKYINAMEQYSGSNGVDETIKVIRKYLL